ncbi:MAG: DUF4115 domain-containing protein [Proteobacteria bacterium]|nr:DUF4115 domain-containing protein [Pseudomonadota bacterium]
MIEPIGEHNTDQTAQAGLPSADGLSAGAMLRQQRESAGVHIDALAGALKVPVAKLQALEADDYAAFTDHVFMRALASSMCRALKVQAAPVLALLPQGAPIHLPPDRAINASFKDSGRRTGKGGSLEPPKSRLVGIAVGALLLGALAVAFLPLPLDMGSQDDRPTQPVTPALSAPPAPVAQEAAATPTAESAAPAPEAQPVGATVEPAAPAAPEGLLVIRAHKEAWIQVRNGAGRVLLQKTLAAGDSYTAEGDPPWHVVIGRADAAEVVVRGQPMNLKAVSRENVARFEVK